MKKIYSISLLVVLLFSLAFAAEATMLYVDSAPNVYGSPDWANWWLQTKSDVVAGTFTNMRTGTFPGTTTMDPYDEIVYSTGDLGKRLHWIYWLPNENIDTLAGRFQVKWVIDWDGADWTYQGGNWALDGPEVGWSQPVSWENYSGGVIGSLGFAWWATDDEAIPYNTDGSPYNETDQADIDALRQQVFDYQTYAIGMVRYKAPGSNEWIYDQIKVDVVPEPGTIILFGTGLASLIGYGRLRFRGRGKKVA